MDFLVVPITPGPPLGQWPGRLDSQSNLPKGGTVSFRWEARYGACMASLFPRSSLTGVRPCPLRRLQPARSTFTAYNTMRSVGAGPGGRMAAVGSGVPTQRFRRILRAAGRRLLTGNEALLQAAG